VLPAEVVVADQGEHSRVDASHSNQLRIRIISARPGGLGAAQNDAVRATSTPIVAILDDDCVAEPGWIETLTRTFADDPELALVTGRVLPIGPEAPDRYAVSSRTRAIRMELGPRSMPWDAGSGNNFAVRREWFDRVRGCDERLGPGSLGQGGVDMDLFYRLLRAGGRARYEPTALVFHERTDRMGRLARRLPYGYGMGACCSLWLRQGDRNALRVLTRWVAMRGNRLARSLVRGRGLAVREELLVLAGTARGLVYGLRAPERPAK